MELIKAGIYLNDRIFAAALAEGLSREAGPIRFYLLSAPGEGDFCDMVLTESGERKQEPFGSGGCEKRSGAVRTVELVKSSEEENIFGKPPYRLYRYKESPNLLNDLLFVYFKMTGRSLENHGDALCRTVVFLSECGGCGATSIALASARMLYQIYGSRVLYLNLCPLNDTGIYLAQSREESFLKLLYYLQQDREFPIGAFITEGEELDHVNTEIVNGYFSEMKPLFMQRFLERTGRLGKYDFLFLDMGNHLSRENKKLLGGAERAVLVSDGQRERSGKYRKEISREISGRMQQGEVLYVKNFAGDVWEEDPETEPEQDPLLYVSRQKDGILKLSGNYGNEIAEIAKIIMEGTAHGKQQSFFEKTD